ncbi:MAG: Abi family protein [Prevotellaceae bacterium]|jgi:abortive infection bacteriophage resistance protein|nr:Abi family protein [Prevotellaceae bacterium]
MSKTAYNKSFISYSDQIELLKSRGMKITDENKTMHLLENISYYRFSAYWYPLLADKRNHIFKSGADFEAAFNLYKFDRELRQLPVSELEKIEISVRAKIAYALSMEYSAFWMEDATLFADCQLYLSTINRIQDELNRSDEEFIIAFRSKYCNRFPPSFILLEITSFGALSRLYGNLKPGKVKRKIANAFGLSDKVFVSWLHCIVYIRNVCAHHARIWNRPMSIQPLFPRNASNVWLTDRQAGINRIFYTLSMILYLLNIINPDHTFRQKLENLFLKYPNVDRIAMGFPASWRNEPLWSENKSVF